MQTGYSEEIQWQESVSFEHLTEKDFLTEYAWVVLASGMREAVVRSKFPLVSQCFYHWSSAQAIARDARECVRAALEVYGHEPKIRAISSTAVRLADEGFHNFKKRLIDQPLSELRSLPYIGPITQYHLAKNIGLGVAKPDRHLTLIAQLFRYPTVEEFCEAVARESGAKVAVVDLVFWRFATLNRDYLQMLSDFV